MPAEAAQAQDPVRRSRSTLALTPGFGGANAPFAPAPGRATPNPDPKNFEGVWWLRGYGYLLGPSPGVPAPLKPQYIDLLKESASARRTPAPPETDTSTACFPHGMPRLMESPYPIEIVQTPGRVTFLHEVAREVRRICLDRSSGEPARAATFLGHSVGHWEGDTLVVGTVGINDKSFIDDEGEAHSTRSTDRALPRGSTAGGRSSWSRPVDDPVLLEHPTATPATTVASGRRPAEYICEENNRNAPVNVVTVAK